LKYHGARPASKPAFLNRFRSDASVAAAYAQNHMNKVFDLQQFNGGAATCGRP